ncbi:tetratricopeptide repeat protein [Gimesia aquarii]|uniref:Cellulose synthase subunit BcsC n=1 Tax=Gimesia aquarii TaxID=2527964 RepID=A0A517WP02_9PLAN|nr:tetratricopeptide repeat protein [Gimesia aquarii]QDU06984.1 cellulose synthase subunit BcsC [Gimesia aquarii]
MIKFVRFLLILFVIELGFCGYLIAKRLSRPLPLLPEAEYVDPLMMADYRELADQAEQGSSKEWMKLGQALLGQGFYSYAEHCFRQAAKLDPTNDLAQASYAFCLERTGRTQESTREYEKLEASSRNKSTAFANKKHVLYTTGRNYLREENAAKAEEKFRQNANFQPADYQLAKLLVRSGQVESALSIIERNLEQSPNSLNFLSLYAQALEASGREVEAIEAAEKVERALEIIPLNFNTEFIQPYSVRHGIEKEVEAYNHLIKRNDMDHLAEKLEEIFRLLEDRPLPQYKATLVSMIEVEFQRKNPERMLMLIEKLKEHGVENAELLQFKAGAYLLSGEMEKAVPLLQRVLKMSPTIEVHQTLANYYEQQNDTEKRDYHQAKMALLYAMIAFRNNQLPAAEEAIQRSVDLNPRDPQAWFYYAETKRHRGDLEAAQTAYEKCIELNPNHGRALKELKRLTAGKDIK